MSTDFQNPRASARGAVNPCHATPSMGFGAAVVSIETEAQRIYGDSNA